MPAISKYTALQILMLLHRGTLAFSLDSFLDAVSIGKTKGYEELNSGRLRAKKLGDKTIIPFWSAIDWLAALPDYPVTTAEAPVPPKTLAEVLQKLFGLLGDPDEEGAVALKGEAVSARSSGSGVQNFEPGERS